MKRKKIMAYTIYKTISLDIYGSVSGAVLEAGLFVTLLLFNTTQENVYLYLIFAGILGVTNGTFETLIAGE